MKLCFIVFASLTSVLFAAGLDTSGGSSAQKPMLDLTLDKTIELALANSLQVKQSKDLLGAAQASAGVAKGSFFPELSAGVTAGTYHDRLTQPGDTSVPLVARDRNAYVAELKASQSIFAGFRDSSNLAAANAQKKVAEKDLEIVKYDIVEQVIQLYFGAQLDLRNLAAEKEIHAMREQQLKEVDSRFRQGSATILDKLQAEYALKAQDPEITVVEADLDSKKIRLARLIGLPLDQSFALKSEFNDAIIDSVLSKLPQFAAGLDFALKNNPHFSKYEAQLSVLQSQSSQSMSKHLPTLDFLVNAGTNAYARYDIGTTDSLTYSAEVKLTVPLFSGLTSFSERAEWQSKLDALKEERASFRENFLDQLNDAYRKLQVASSKLEAQTVNVKLADLTVKQARGFYGLGRAKLSDVLDSYSRALQAKKNLAQAMYDRVFALYHIKTALGAGLANFEETAPSRY